MYHPIEEDDSISSISPEPLDLSTSLAECSPSDQRVQTLTRCSTLKKFLIVPEHQLKHPSFGPKTSARVLTSNENIRIFDEKTKKKKEKEAEKMRRKEEIQARKGFS